MNISEFIQQITQLEKEMDAIYHSVAIKYRLSDSALWVLYMLTDSKEPCTQQDLCQQSYFPKQTVNSSVNRLAEDGFVRLETIPGTRNQKRILLTDAGKDLTKKTADRLREAEKKAYGKLTAEERGFYLEATRKITESLWEETQKL